MEETVSPQDDFEKGQRGEWKMGDSMGCGVCNVETEEHGVVLPSIPTAPYIPARQERLEHEVTHVPYRSWREHCVKGKARSTPHRYESGKVDGVPVIGLDYCFMSKKDEDPEFKSEVTVLSMKDKVSTCVLQSQFHRKV